MITHFYHRHQMHRLAGHPDLSYFEAAIWLHTLAYSLISIFVPILLVQTGYSIRDVLIYYLVFNAIDSPLNFLVDRLVRRIGARKVIILATFAVICFFGLLGLLPPNNWPLLIFLAFLAAAYDTLFWVSHFYMFIEANREDGLNAGSKVGALGAVRKMASIAGPVVGGLVLLAGGKLSLTIVSIAIFALSIVPLYKMRHVRDIPQGQRLPLKEYFRGPEEKRDYLSMALSGIHGEVDGVLWPLFIFSVFGTIGSVAALPVIVSATAATFSYLAGKLSQRYATSMMAVGSLVICCAWILRVATQDPVIYYLTVFLVGLFSMLLMVPLDGSIVSRGLALEPLSASTYRNTFSMFSRVPLYIVLLVLLEVFKVGFSLAAISIFFILLTVLAYKAPGGRR